MPRETPITATPSCSPLDPAGAAGDRDGPPGDCRPSSSERSSPAHPQPLVRRLFFASWARSVERAGFGSVKCIGTSYSSGIVSDRIQCGEQECIHVVLPAKGVRRPCPRPVGRSLHAAGRPGHVRSSVPADPRHRRTNDRAGYPAALWRSEESISRVGVVRSAQLR